LTVKANQSMLSQELGDLFDYATTLNWQPVIGDEHQTLTKAHGRFERRRCWTLADPDFLFALRDRQKWPRLATLVKVTTKRTVGTTTAVETRFFLESTKKPGGLPHLTLVRRYWSRVYL
jgi:hypothetical protein